MYTEPNDLLTTDEQNLSRGFENGNIFLENYSVSNYTKSVIIRVIPKASYTGNIKRIPAPDALKKRMFTMSSKAIAKALD